MVDGALTTDDLDLIADSLVSADDVSPDRRLAEAERLLLAVRQGLIAEPGDTGYALLLAAELVEQSGDLSRAEGIAIRAVEANRSRPARDGIFPQVYHAGLLLKLGSRDAALAELVPLWADLRADPLSTSYVSGLLAAHDMVDRAEELLTAALTDAIGRHSGAGRGVVASDDEDERSFEIFTLAQQRSQVRSGRGEAPDHLDRFAEDLRVAFEETGASAQDEDYDGTAVLFWPQADHEHLLREWPALAGSCGETWDQHRAGLERWLAYASERGETGLAVLSGSAAGLLRFATRCGGDPQDAEVRARYLDETDETLLETAWPPERNAPCWCGSGLKYKKCCRRRV